MTMTTKRDPLGLDPFSQSPISKGIFSKTTDLPQETKPVVEQVVEEPDVVEVDVEVPSPTPKVGETGVPLKTKSQKPETIKQKTAIDFLDEDQPTEKITLQIPVEWNEVIDRLVRDSKRKHGAKIKKQTWIRAAIELLMSSPLNLSEIDSVETFRLELQKLSADMNAAKTRKQKK